MLLRRGEGGEAGEGGALAIGQPSHAWISGQLACSWGNDRFGGLEPCEEICLAAEQHDIGMAKWDLQPTFNPQTGLPRAFTEMPLAVHLDLWRNAPRHLLRQSRYASLLVSMHGSRLYERRDLTRLAPEQAQEVTEFLEEQGRLQRNLLDSLRGDPSTAATAVPELIDRNSRLIWTWDSLSLAICLDWAPTQIKDIPAAEGSLDISLAPGDRPNELTLDPWPFSRRRLVLRCEGQRLLGRAGSQDELDRMLAEAPWETLEFTLIPAPGSNDPGRR